jgi:hypothetical protein
VGLQSETRAALRGKYFRDYVNSVRGLSGWGDGDGFMANYIGHPMQGSIASLLALQNDAQFRSATIGKNRRYWLGRFRGAAWGTLHSFVYELSPVGDAAIGNVGLRAGTKGAVDLVITPVLGFGWLVMEDSLDRWVIKKLENKTQSSWKKLLLRSGLNPTRSFANVLRGRVPWHRDDRPGVRRLQEMPIPTQPIETLAGPLACFREDLAPAIPQPD